jgi:hypothetical protein
MSERPFNTGDAIAYFITWTTYGTWLPGDDRGWHRWGEADLRPPNELFAEMAASEMKEAGLVLTPEDRAIVERTIARHCEIRGWTLHAARARSNHGHVVGAAAGYPPKIVREQLKAWCTRHLKSRHPRRVRVWTEGGSCRWINHQDDLYAAIAYVNEAQDRKGIEYEQLRMRARRASE